MPIDYETVRRNNLAREAERRNREAVEGIKLGHNLTEAEASWLADRRREEAERREQETHVRERRDFASHALERALEARKAGDAYRAKVWDEAIVHIGQDKWPISKIIQSDPAVMRFGSLRTRLNYRGSNVQISEE